MRHFFMVLRLKLWKAKCIVANVCYINGLHFLLWLFFCFICLNRLSNKKVIIFFHTGGDTEMRCFGTMRGEFIMD